MGTIYLTVKLADAPTPGTLKMASFKATLPEDSDYTFCVITVGTEIQQTERDTELRKEHEWKLETPFEF